MQGYWRASSQIVVHDHDVLSGRGVNIAQHPGNERFRVLVNSRHDASHWNSYTTSEKRAVAEEIIAHIQSLDPPGRFLRRASGSRSTRGLDGPWEEMSEREAIKKTCQALRDCNRQDREGYASAVEIPPDVRDTLDQRSKTGLTNKQQAEQAVKASSKRPISPSVENAAEWLKKQRTPLPTTTPSTQATSAASMPPPHDGSHLYQPSSPSNYTFSPNLEDYAFKPSDADLDPLHIATEAAAAAQALEEHEEEEASAGFPPSPFHDDGLGETDSAHHPHHPFGDDED